MPSLDEHTGRNEANEEYFFDLRRVANAFIVHASSKQKSLPGFRKALHVAKPSTSHYRANRARHVTARRAPPYFELLKSPPQAFKCANVSSSNFAPPANVVITELQVGGDPSVFVPSTAKLSSSF